MPVIIHKDKGGRRPTRENVLASKPNRKRLNGAHDVLAVTGIPRGYVGRWVNDEKDRIYRFLEAGWEFLTSHGVVIGDRTIDTSTEEGKSQGSVVSRRVGMTPEGRPLEAFLLVIEEEFYEDDQRLKQKRIDRAAKAIDNPDPAQGQYKAQV